MQPLVNFKIQPHEHSLFAKVAEDAAISNLRS